VKVQASHLSHPLPLKWRGVVLYQYDGHSWARQDREPERYARVPGRLYSLNPRGAGDQLITQTIYLEPLDTDVLFVAPRIVAVSDDVPYLMTDASDSLRTQPHPDHAIRYVAYSDISRPPDEELKYSSVVPVPAVRDYLEVPAGLDPRIRELAFEVTKHLPTHIQKSRELEGYLRTRYAHTLDLRGTHKDPLARFLFEVKEGNCEYFASALAVMLRYLGIPTRLVNGFQVGDYNRLGNDYIVRQSDAHTWVEAFFPDGGWIEFDPTPPSSSGPGRGVLLTWLTHALDAVDLFWTEEVIQYSLWKQVRLFRSVRRSLDRQRDEARFWYRRWEIRLERWAVRSFRNVRAVPIQRLMLIVALGIGVPFFLWWAFRRWGWRWRLRRSRQPQRAAVIFYGRMLDLLRRRGHPKHAGQTAWEFASGLTIPQRDACLRLTSLYQKARFSRLPLSPDELRAVEDSLRQLQTRGSRAGDARSPAS
ncbi:MAG: DUF3488 domain-containing protein, partial [Acidobacteria bacterium]|nr:DUF3488 domain-containing protein [Acidobacteriota bacterium]